MAVSRKIGKLGFEISADVKKLRNGLDRAQGRIRGFARGATRTLGKVTAAFGALGIAIGGLATIRGFKSTIENLEAIAIASNRIGLTTTALQEYVEVLKFSNVTQEQFITSIQRLGRRAQDAIDGSNALREAFLNLNVSLTDTQGNTRDINDIFEDTLAALKNIQNPIERNAAAFKLFDTEGVPAIAALTDTYDDLIGRVRASGAIIEEEAIQRASKLNEQFTEASTVIQGKFKRAFVELIPVITRFAEFVARASEEITLLAESFGLISREVDFIDPKLVRLTEEFEAQRKALEDNKATTEAIIAAYNAGDFAAENLTAALAAQSESFRKIKERYDAALATLQAYRGELDKTKESSDKLTGDGRADVADPLQPTPTGRTEKTTTSNLGRDFLERSRQIDVALIESARERVRAVADLDIQLAKERAEAEMERADNDKEIEEGLNQFILARRRALNKDLEILARERLETEANILEELRTPTERLFDEWRKLGERTEQVWTDALDRSTDALTDFVTTGKLNFKDLAQSIIQDLIRIRLQAAIADLGGLLGGGGGGGAGGFLKGLFGGERQRGGRVDPGRSFIVGEKEPEVFTPDSPGNIIPFSRAKKGVPGSSSGPVSVNIVNNGTPQQTDQVNTIQNARGTVIDIVMHDLNTGGRLDRQLSQRGLRR